MPRHKKAVSGLSMSNAEVLEAALFGLERQRSEIEEKMAELRRQIGGDRAGQPRRASVKVDSAAPAVKKRRLSAAARRRIAEAQRKRWAAIKKAASAPKKRRISAAGRARIIAATRKRWAAFHAKKAAPAKAARKTR